MGLMEGWMTEMNSKGILNKKKAMKKIVEKGTLIFTCKKYNIWARVGKKRKMSII